MRFPEKETVDQWRQDWTDRYVRIRSAEEGTPLHRFVGRVGRVITVNYSGRAVVDFADGAWYDIGNFTQCLETVTDAEEIKNYQADVNSAQAYPTRQG